MTAEGTEAPPARPDSAGCLLVVAGYNDITSALRSITDEAASRINVSPELGDFFEVRFIRLGWRPAPGAGRDEALTRLAAALIRPVRVAARHYFALLIADRSATVVERLLSECGAHPIIGRLPIRYRGLASIDDRPTEARWPDPRGEAGQQYLPGGILIAQTGAWQRRGLILQVQRFAGELQLEFAAGAETGLTADQLATMRADAGDEGADPPHEHDELTPVPDEGAMRRREVPSPSEAAGEVAPPATRLTLPPPPLTPPRGVLPRLLPALRPDIGRARALWPPTGGGRSALGSPEVPHDSEPRPQPSVLVLLALLGDEGMAERSAWRRGQSVLLEIDGTLAVARGFACRVQALRGSGDAGMTDPREAGRLTRHGIGHPAGILDFPRVLHLVRTALRCDVTAANLHGVPALRPTVVFYAADVPFADMVAAELYAELTREAAITWIVPERLDGLLSPRLVAGGTQVLADHSGIADEVISLLSIAERHEDE